MTVIATGSTLDFNFMVADAITTRENNEGKIYNISNKIVHLTSSDTYVSVVGSGIIINGVEILDDWFTTHNNIFDLTNPTCLSLLYDYLKKVQDYFDQVILVQNFLYVCSREYIAEIIISQKKRKLKVNNPKLIPESKFCLNYGSNVTRSKLDEKNRNEVVKETIELILQEQRKEKLFPYDDFKSRFTSVVMPKAKSEAVIFVPPYKKLSDYFFINSAEIGNIDDGKFDWNPAI